jgi:predicted DNA-binding transcriptional regulator YafY
MIPEFALRLAGLLRALDETWQGDERLVHTVALYPENRKSASRMLRRDIDTLRELGFVIERRKGKTPLWRLLGHARCGPLDSLR